MLVFEPDTLEDLLPIANGDQARECSSALSTEELRIVFTDGVVAREVVSSA